MGRNPMARTISLARLSTGFFDSARALCTGRRSGAGCALAMFGMPWSLRGCGMSDPHFQADDLPLTRYNIRNAPQFHKFRVIYYLNLLPRPISCRRSGRRSMARPISRTSQGEGLRILTCPSLSINNNEKPRGWNCWRQMLLAAGSMSITTTASRASKAAAPRCNASICSASAGSPSVSAKTTTGRFDHRKSSGATSAAARNRASGAAGSTGSSASTLLCAMGGSRAGLRRTSSDWSTAGASASGGGASRAGPMADRAITKNRNFNFIGTSSSYEYRVERAAGKDAS